VTIAGSRPRVGAPRRDLREPPIGAGGRPQWNSSVLEETRSGGAAHRLHEQASGAERQVFVDQSTRVRREQIPPNGELKAKAASGGAPS